MTDEFDLNDLEGIALTWDQLDWLREVNMFGPAYWIVDENSPHIQYRENKRLKIQVTRNTEDNTFRVWTWK